MKRIPSPVPVDRSMWGSRKPHHDALTPTTDFRRLQPFMAHPVRPGEIIQGASIVSQHWFDKLVNPRLAPFTRVELGLWLVPLSTLGPEFIQMIVNDAEDHYELTGETSAGTIAEGRLRTTTAVGSQNPFSNSPGLQWKNRTWAGEIGRDDDNVVPAGLYMPYVSMSTFQVAWAYYELEYDDYEDETARGSLSIDFADQPPIVGEYIRGASINSVPTGGAANIDSIPTSVTDLLQKIGLLESENRTYAEYLAGHGIDPMRASSMPRPLYIGTRLLRPQGDLQSFAIRDSDDRQIGPNTTNVQMQVEKVTDSAAFTTPTIAFESGGFTGLAAEINDETSIGVMCHEPSVILGTIVAWPSDLAAGDYAHHMDINLMRAGHTWGDASMGDIDRSDFLQIQELRTPTGAAAQIGQDEQVGNLGLNFLNLYLNGDTFCSKTSQADYIGPGGYPINASNRSVTSQMSVQLSIKSDLASV